MSYLIYLRKSRSDREAESRGEGETLARHEKILSDLAAKMKLPIGAIYKEVVSGENITARPKMQQLLIEVMQGKWEGVLVVEIERLARGDTKDQGTVAEAFKFSNTKIITPLKIYDPSNEYDEEYFEFNLFMSRKEYKTINRRLQRGRLSAFEEGWYIAGTAPYGYSKVKHPGDKGYTLDIIPEEGKVIEYITDMYTRGELQEDGSYLRLGSYQIRDRLNDMKIPTRTGVPWSASSIIDILNNPIYAGLQRWQWRKVQKQMIDGEIVESRKKDPNCPLVPGRHPEIISREKYDLIQKIRRGKPTPINTNNALQNPLSGLVYCAKCNTMMTRQASNTKLHYPILRCPNSRCNNVSSPLDLIENKVIEGLKDWLEKYELDWPDDSFAEYSTAIETLENAIKSLSVRYEKISKQLASTYDLLEQGVYTLEVFQERQLSLTDQKKQIASELENLKNDQNTNIAMSQAIKNFVPNIRHLINVYWEIEDATTRNNMLKEVLQRIEYLKTERNRKGDRNNANFTLHLFPKLPENL